MLQQYLIQTKDWVQSSLSQVKRLIHFPEGQKSSRDYHWKSGRGKCYFSTIPLQNLVLFKETLIKGKAGAAFLWAQWKKRNQQKLSSSFSLRIFFPKNINLSPSIHYEILCEYLRLSVSNFSTWQAIANTSFQDDKRFLDKFISRISEQIYLRKIFARLSLRNMTLHYASLRTP